MANARDDVSADSDNNSAKPENIAPVKSSGEKSADEKTTVKVPIEEVEREVKSTSERGRNLKAVEPGIEDRSTLIVPTPELQRAVQVKPERGGNVALRRFRDLILMEKLSSDEACDTFKTRVLDTADQFRFLELLHPGALVADVEYSRFRADAELAMNLPATGFLRVLETGKLQGHVFVIREYVEGKTLEHESLPIGREIAAQRVVTLARSLHEAHRRGMLHPDLSPRAVWLDQRGNPLLSGFGWVSNVERESSVSFLATEEVLRRTPYNPTRDIYRLGGILYYCIMGHAPYVAKSRNDLAILIESQEIMRPRQRHAHMPEDFEIIIMKCLEREPRRRYATANELADDLDRWLNGQPIRAQVNFLRRTMEWFRRRDRS